MPGPQPGRKRPTQFRRGNYRNDRIFSGYDDIVALCCHAWNKLIEQPRVIIPIDNRKWAHGFRSAPVGICHTGNDSQKVNFSC